MGISEVKGVGNRISTVSAKELEMQLSGRELTVQKAAEMALLTLSSG